MWPVCKFYFTLRLGFFLPCALRLGFFLPCALRPGFFLCPAPCALAFLFFALAGGRGIQARAQRAKEKGP